MRSWINCDFSEEWLRERIASRKAIRGHYHFDPFQIAGLAGAKYNPAAVKKVVMFFETCLVHVEGEFADQPFCLLEWQVVDILAPIFGFILPSGYRMFRTTYIEVPRKNGKSTLLAGILLYLLTADKEAGAKIVTAATSKEQAKIVFSVAAQMVEKSPELSKRIMSYKIGSMIVEKTHNVLTAIASIARHGKNLHGLGIDELHEHQDSEMIDSLVTSMGARRQPLTVFITTAGLNKGTICWKEREYAIALISGKKRDQSYLPAIYSAEESIQIDPYAWKDPKVWAIANPSLGYSVTEEYLAQELKKAEFSPANEATFKRLYLNIWSSLSAKWLSMRHWKACYRDIKIEDFKGQEAFLGFDASATRDLTALSVVFRKVIDSKDHYFVFWFHWLPASRLEERKNHEGIDWTSFFKSGELKITDSESVDYKAISDQIADLEKIGIKIKQIGFDKWNAHALSNDLSKKGYEMIEVGQSIGSISGPAKEFERLILDGRIHFARSAIVEMQAEKVEIYTDANGNIKPVKGQLQKKKTGGQVTKIDGIISAIIALSRAYSPHVEEKKAQNIYG